MVGSAKKRAALEPHSQCAPGCIDRYDATHSEAQVTAGWVQLATRYANASNIIGADLKNEPFQGTWAEDVAATGALMEGRLFTH